MFSDPSDSEDDDEDEVIQHLASTSGAASAAATDAADDDTLTELFALAVQSMGDGFDETMRTWRPEDWLFTDVRRASAAHHTCAFPILSVTAGCGSLAGLRAASSQGKCSCRSQQQRQ